MFRKKQKRQGRLQKKRSGQSSHFAVRLLIWCGIPLGVVAVLILAGSGMKHLFYAKNPHFTLRESPDVIIKKGDITADLVRKHLDLTPGESNLYQLEVADLRDKLLEDPIIQEAEVRRIHPDRLEVTVYGRTPVAQLLGRGGRLLDAEGYVMPPGNREENLDLPILTGIHGATQVGDGDRLDTEMARKALNLISYRKTMEGGNMVSIRLIQCNEQYDELIVYLKGQPQHKIRNGARVVLPAKKLKESFENILQVLEYRSLAGQPTSYINATYRRMPVTP